MDIKHRLMNEKPQVWKDFEMCTKDFKKLTVEKIDDKTLFAYKAKYLDVDYAEPYMIYIIFVQLLGFEHTYKPMEKVLYEIPFQYKGYYCVFAMEKFGLKFFINSKDEASLELIFSKIKRATKIVERLLKPIVTESIDNGEVTIENQSGTLRRRYLYFRSRTEKIIFEYNSGELEESISMAERINRKVELKELIIFNTQAMLEAYFSFQEHLLILLLPFANINFKEKKITHLINSSWTQKFNEVFSPAEKPTLMKHFEALRNLKELRNKYAHGGFEKSEGSILPQVEGVGAIPIEMPSNREELFSFTLKKDIDFNESCEIIDDFENYLYASNWSRAIKILEYGIDMRFDKEYILDLKLATESNENLEVFLEKEAYLYERQANMDW
ncbi:hypothetical protein [Virgibacillus halodenitrificans]|uniref:hypothetical protein n=1 Tax=Virgibacillus halodenitrificans TaxID=1482 RepID=UPI002DB8FD15|nr:hypothetical protein [Virgibacillus halodenitrificans]MEC2159753.1 hypothetical protein [Virgibacillus halodenitrificans]